MRYEFTPLEPLPGRNGPERNLANDEDDDYGDGSEVQNRVIAFLFSGDGVEFSVIVLSRTWASMERESVRIQIGFYGERATAAGNADGGKRAVSIIKNDLLDCYRWNSSGS